MLFWEAINLDIGQIYLTDKAKRNLLVTSEEPVKVQMFMEGLAAFQQ